MNSPQRQIIALDIIVIVISILLIIIGYDMINRIVEVLRYNGKMSDTFKTAVIGNTNVKGSLLFIAGLVGLAIGYSNIHKQWEITVNNLYKEDK